MLRDVADILDRWAISTLKSQRIGTEENKREYEAFEQERQVLINKYPNFDVEQYSKFLLDINSTIWFLESSLKSNKEILPEPHFLDSPQNLKILAEIGKNTILIRNINHLRVSFKNIVNKLLKSGFQDIKLHHLSE